MVSLYWKNLSESKVKVDKFSSLSKDEVLSNAVKYKREERIHSRILDELDGVETNKVDSQTVTQPSEICPQKLSSLTEGNFLSRFHSTPTVALQGKRRNPAFELAIPKTRPIAAHKVPEPVVRVSSPTNQQMLQPPVKSAPTKPVFTFKPIPKRAVSELPIVNADTELDGLDEESLFGAF